MDQKPIPIWVVEEKKKSFRKVDFEWIYPNKQDLNSISLIFTYNSYRVFADGSFSINGGPRIKVGGVVKNSQFMCVRRHTKSIPVGGGEEKEEVSYLLGFLGDNAKGEEAQIYVHVSPDGKEFKWTKER
jgi:hypothetical protein